MGIDRTTCRPLADHACDACTQTTRVMAYWTPRGTAAGDEPDEAYCIECLPETGASELELDLLSRYVARQ